MTWWVYQVRSGHGKLCQSWYGSSDWTVCRPSVCKTIRLYHDYYMHRLHRLLEISPTIILLTGMGSRQQGGRERGKGEGGIQVPWKAPVCPSSGGRGPGRATAREWRRLGLSPFRENPPSTNTKTGRCQYLEDNSGSKRQGNRDTEGPAMG